MVGTNMAKSDPNWTSSEHKVSSTAILNSLFEDVSTRTSGWIIRDAWSEKLTRLESPSIVTIARLRSAVDASDRSYVLTIMGMTRCKYSSMFEPNVKNASNTLICVAERLSFNSPSNTFKIRGRIVGRNGLNSASRALPSDSMSDTSGSCNDWFSQRSVTSAKISGIYLRTCCLIMPIRMASCCRWNSCKRAAELRVTAANAGMI